MYSTKPKHQSFTCEKNMLLQGKMKGFPALNRNRGCGISPEPHGHSSSGLDLKLDQPWWELTTRVRNIYFKNPMTFYIFPYLSFTFFFQNNLNYFKTEAFFTMLKRAMAIIYDWDNIFADQWGMPPWKLGIGGHSNLCGRNGPVNKLRLLDQPLLANWQSLFSVKSWHFWEGFNKKTFSKALVRLQWTQLRTKPNYPIQNWVTIMGQTLWKASYIYYLI